MPSFLPNLFALGVSVTTLIGTARLAHADSGALSPGVTGAASSATASRASAVSPAAASVPTMFEPATPAAKKYRWPIPALNQSYSRGPEVLFTFDDGPHDQFTPKVLDVLKSYHVKAIFFTAGWRLTGERAGAEKRRKILARIFADGHLVGNHTINHAHMCLVSAKKGAWEIDENAKLLGELAGMVISYFRTPYGARCRRIENLLRDRQLSHLHWDFDAREYRDQDADRTVHYLTGQIRRLEGRAVILMHDTQPATARALPRILNWITVENQQRKKRGARVIRILSYADLARETVTPEVVSDLAAAQQSLAGWLPSLGRRLLVPLAGDPTARASEANQP